MSRRRTVATRLNQDDDLNPVNLPLLRKAPCFSKPYWRQGVAAFIAMITMDIVGTINGWTTISLYGQISKTNGSALRLTYDEYSWMVSLTVLGSMIGSIVAAHLVDRSGRKYCLLVCNTIFTIGWFFVYKTTSVRNLYLARMILGIGVGIAHTIIPMYVSEVANNSYRGALLTLIAVNLIKGSVLVCILRLVLTYKLLVTGLVILSFMSLFSNTLFPETPYFLLANGRKQRALKSIAYYKGIVDPHTVEIELLPLRAQTRYEIPSQSRSDSPSISRSELPLQSRSDLPLQSRSDLPSQSRNDLPSQSRNDLPSQSRSDLPSQSRSDLPSTSRSDLPSTSRSELPSTSRSELPSQSRSYLPSTSRSELPSQSRSYLPSTSRSDLPSQSRSYLPSTSRSDLPSQSRSDLPSTSRSDLPSQSRSDLPSTSRSELPSTSRSDLLSQSRSDIHSQSRSELPSQSRSDLPSQSRSDLPSTSRSDLPSQSRSDLPSTSRSDLPSQSRSDLPSTSRSDLPSQSRSDLPSTSITDSYLQSIYSEHSEVTCEIYSESTDEIFRPSTSEMHQSSTSEMHQPSTTETHQLLSSEMHRPSTSETRRLSSSEIHPDPTREIHSRSRSDLCTQSYMDSRAWADINEIRIDFTKYTWSTKLRAILEPSNKKALIIMLGLTMAQQFGGNFMTIQYLRVLFTKAEINIDPYKATIMFHLLGILCSCSTIVTVEYYGRRLLLILSTFGSFCALMFIATYLFLIEHKHSPSTNAIPIFTLIIYQAAFQIGLGTLPNIFRCELFPTELRGVVGAIIVIFDGIIGFIVWKLYVEITNNIGLYAIYMIFATSCFLAFMMVIIWVPETKGKTYREIKAHLLGRNFNSSNEEVRV